MHFGHPYTMRYQFGRVDVREDTRNNGSASVKAGRYQNLFGLLKFANTNNFTVSVQIQQETPATMTYTASLGNDGGGSVKLDNGEYRFPTLTKTDNLTIEVTNATPFPCTILGAEWIANFTTNFQRYRA
jgi:predicted GNAT superfamily acetyltransferase